MAVNVQRLREKIAEGSKTQESIADAMGMNRSTFYRKMKSGGDGFTVGEIHKMMKYIPLTKREATDIFLSQ